MMVKKLCNFSVIDLIGAVEKRPCLWDRRRDEYKDRLVKDKAWKEVANILYDKYEEFDEQEQKRIEALLLDRWRNIRDAFIKSLRRTNDSSSIKRKYMYHDHLTFLFSNHQREETSSSTNYDESESMEAASESYTEEEEVEIDDKQQIIVEVPERLQTRKRKANNTTENGVECVSVSASCSSAVKAIDEDEAFLWSLLPSMRKLTRDHNFQFRIEVMQLLQKYKLQTQMQKLQSSFNQ